MKNLKLTIRIKKPVKEVFAFIINPKNTPNWLDSIVTEETNEWPVKVGTKYKNKSKNGSWLSYTITDYIENERFVFTKEDNNYHVRYLFSPIDENTTEIEYYEWVNVGDLEEPFTQEILQKLKSVLENSMGGLVDQKQEV